jgi:serpin B
VLIAVLALAGCGSRSPGTPTLTQAAEVRATDPRTHAEVPAGDAASLRSGNSTFAGSLLGLLSRNQPTVALSPFSISDALAMTFAGARGETASQIAAALRFGLPPARLHAALNALGQALQSVNGRGVTLRIANALYGQRGTQFRQTFLSLLARDYGAGMRIVDFERAADAARNAIDAWVSDQTRGKIPQLLAPGDLDQLTRLVLVNAVYLNAHWGLPFESHATAPAPFHSPSGTVQVPTMHQTAGLGYLSASGYRALELPYRGGRLAFDVLLPDPGRLDQLLSAIAKNGPLELLRGLQPRRVQLALPKLLLRTRFELSSALRSLGMPLAFEPGSADLSGIAGRPGELYIKAVVHEAYLRVDEAGTEAAAATGAVAETTAAVAPVQQPVVFNVDRPFVFVIRDTSTGAILFLGVVSEP